MDQTIYKYKLKEGEPPITQGDVFNNLPYFSYDFLLRSSPRSLDVFKNENKDILTEVIQNSAKVQFEGFFYPKWGIIASQDCDIKPKKDLIFYPLEKTNVLIDEVNIISAVNTKIKNTTRRLYLPKLYCSKGQIYGPFEIIFHNPFNVPYELVLNNLNKCWKARLIESARKIFIGKLSQFFTRLPIEEFMFLENQEITKYLKEDWKQFWKDKKTSENFNSRVKKIGEILDVLKFVKRKEDISKIFYYDIEIIKRIKNILSLVDWFPKAENLIKQSNQILGSYEENPSEASNLFEILIKDFIIDEEPFRNQFYDFYDNNSEEIMKMRRGVEIVKGILPDQLLELQEDYKECASNVYDAKALLDKIPKFLIKYEELFEILEKNKAS